MQSIVSGIKIETDYLKLNIDVIINVTEKIIILIKTLRTTAIKENIE